MEEDEMSEEEYEKFMLKKLDKAYEELRKIVENSSVIEIGRLYAQIRNRATELAFENFKIEFDKKIESSIKE